MEDRAEDGAAEETVFGTYLHGLFDSGELVDRLAQYLAGRKGITVSDKPIEPRAAYRNRQYDLLADAVRESLDMVRIYEIMEEYADENTSFRY
jgi:adenosylcobyric acid synthase